MFRGSFSLFNFALYTICLLCISFFISCIPCLFLDKKGEKNVYLTMFDIGDSMFNIGEKNVYLPPCVEKCSKCVGNSSLCFYGDFVLRGRILVLRWRKEFLPNWVKDLRESFNVKTFIHLR